MAQPPSAPVIINAPNAETPNQLEYTWYPPRDFGSPAIITGYRLTVNPGNLVYTMGPVTDFKVLGLTNAQFYSAYIEATNDNGVTYGPPAYFMDFQTGSLPPLGPSTATASIVGVSSASISWTPPLILPDATIFWYYIESRSTNPADPVISTNGWSFMQSNVLIPRLNLGSQYFFNVQAANCPGYSPIVSTNLITFRGTVTGGTVTQVGGFTIHTFSNVGTTTCVVSNTSITVELLVVAGGGGGGGGDGGGGGGAGGLVYQASYVLTPGTYTVTIGGGGGGGSSNNAGADGGNSVFGPIVALGGGGGAGAGTLTGRNGGSGGGGTHEGAVGQGGQGQQPSRPSPSTGFGNNGGASNNTGPWGGGGGGGAGAGGGNGSGSTGGNGGVGRQYNISGTLLFYAGGGGGSTGGSGGGTGGSGGGGNGGASNGQVGSNGGTNTGGGAGGGNNNSGGSGGSGIVILRYAT